jgi:hypothetical protein
MTRRTQTTQPIEECHWSVPAVRSDPMSDHDRDFETYWTCERTGTAVQITQADCARCTHWTPERHRPAKWHRH